jgi:hypothetical protein
MRCFNGQPDDRLQAYFYAQAELRRQINALGYTVTWFPNGEFYQAFKDYQPATGECKTLEEVLLSLKS